MLGRSFIRPLVTEAWVSEEWQQKPKAVPPGIPWGAACEADRIQEKTAELLKLGSDMKQERAMWWANAHSWNEKRKQRREDRTNVNQLKQMVYILENELDSLLVCEGKVRCSACL